MARKHEKDGLVVLAVNFWDEDRETLHEFARSRKLRQRILLNGSSVGSLYEVSAVPTSFWINRDGVVVDFQGGADGTATLDKKTLKLLGKSK